MKCLIIGTAAMIVVTEKDRHIHKGREMEIDKEMQQANKASCLISLELGNFKQDSNF